MVLAITAAKVKLALFDVAEDKAAGLDGYTSGFYKAAWPIMGYNQQRLPPRCALKVDIRKAYDTINGDIFLVTLQLFGFLNKFISSIEECVTTPLFFIGINETPHGFFVGPRGLRQGDRMSPYLFFLIVEVLNLILQQLIDQDMNFAFHWKCAPLRLVQLGFADGLLLVS
ncbi:uncharacterized protein LOC105178786 [Sesamum indicum]|uniref:Uncharacterized protein LOC105178786 n=1 Tax=Sesamum indicum TaxID=4182 RepID=A0A6I9UPX7_SESIN|nr:uncharacterized protein LOC105178786 [Sesamum indicum]